jgi:hypothetical protein
MNKNFLPFQLFCASALDSSAKLEFYEYNKLPWDKLLGILQTTNRSIKHYTNPCYIMRMKELPFKLYLTIHRSMLCRVGISFYLLPIEYTYIMIWYVLCLTNRVYCFLSYIR